MGSSCQSTARGFTKHRARYRRSLVMKTLIRPFAERTSAAATDVSATGRDASSRVWQVRLVQSLHQSLDDTADDHKRS